MTEPAPEYKVEIDQFSGPLDLLLFLIRREEVDLWNIPIARITEQYLKYVEVLTDLNINLAGEFLVMAATLIEIKSRMMAPNPEPMPDDEEAEDPRMDLVHQLLEYRKFKEAAQELAKLADERNERYARHAPQASEPDRPQAAPLGVDLWILLDAFAKLLKQTGASHQIHVDDVPQEVYMRRLEEHVRTAGRVTFHQVFEGPPERRRLIGMFFALLELGRQQVFRLEQANPFDEIWLTYIPPEERPYYVAPAPEAPAEPEPVPSRAAVPFNDEDEDAWPADKEIEMPDIADAPPEQGRVNDEDDDDEDDEEDEAPEAGA